MSIGRIFNLRNLKGNGYAATVSIMIQSGKKNKILGSKLRKGLEVMRNHSYKSTNICISKVSRNRA